MAGRGAHVTAIDIDTRFVDQLASDSIEVRRVDIHEDELPQAEFDLVHSRLVLEHLADRRPILDRLVATLRPGGWIVIEDYDWSCFGFEGENPGFSDGAEVILGFMAKARFERDYGRRVVGDMEAAGLTELRGEGRARLIDSSSPGFDFFRLTFESLRGVIMDAGLLSAEEADAASARFGETVQHADDDGRDRPPPLSLTTKSVVSAQTAP